MDPLSIVQDEVALEGLDGITIPSLWIRLEDRSPNFQLNLDPYTKEYIWKSLVINADLNFYELPQERNDVVLFDRFEDIDPDTGIQAAQGFSDTTNDIYPVHIIEEDKRGIQGSCIFYKERKNVTNIVRSKDLTVLVSLEEAFNRFGRQLVVVACQELRFRTLISDECNPELKLTDHSYCILERLGRARWQGELQRDLHTCSFKTDAGKMHYLRSSLDRHGLITMQSHVIRLPSGQQQHSLLLLLKRFHIIRRSKYDILMESMSNILLETPDQIASMITLREQLDVSERTFKRIYQYMLSAKLVQVTNRPVEALNPSAKPCNTKKGSKVIVRCVRLIKPYVKKQVVVNDDDNEDEDGAGVSGKSLPVEGRVMERDLISQAYQIVVSSGTMGISQSALRLRMNVGKLEVRMLVRMLQRTGKVKGFMEDEGRQRTTKFISHRCVGMSDRLHQFAKERERNQLLCSETGKGAEGGSGESLKVSNTASSKTPSASRSKTPSASRSKTPSASRSKTPSTSRSKTPRRTKTPPVKDGEGEEGGREGEQTCSDGQQVEGDGGLDGGREGGRKEAERNLSEQTRVNVPVTHSTPIRCKAPPPAQAGTNKKSASQSLDSTVEEGEESVVSPDISLDQSDCPNAASNEPNDSITVVEDVPEDKPWRTKLTNAVDRPRETYRLLKRKNMIVESVRSLKIIEGLYTLQKMINEEEKQAGVSTKCCKKSILRLVSCLSRKGLLKMYTTTVIQDGVSKKVEFVVHPSIQPNDPIVKSAIEQVRFRISSSYSVARAQQAEEKAKDQGNEGKGKNASPTKAQRSKADRKKAAAKVEALKPTIVRGMSRALGYQPKMHRLRLIHNFIWYIVYGHPLRQHPEGTQTPAQSSTETNASNADDAAAHTNTPETPEPSDLSRSVEDDSTSKEANDPQNIDGQTAISENPPSSAGDQQPTEPTLPRMETASSAEEEEELKDTTNLGHFDSDVKVYVEEDSWRRFVPPTPVHREFGFGWGLVSDLLLCLPLSLYVQVIQVNYVVDGLDAYLNDPVKQHYLIRFLPSKMRRQMLYKRRYIFNFHENMQKLSYMGLLQFGPVEKFQDKDQVFVYLRRKATIVDTTSSEPHYWQVTEPPGKTFERRQYTLHTVEDVENYWFDLLCVCLNTPLGVVCSKKNVEPEVPERYKFLRMADLLKGSREVCDDGSVPGDGKGAGGLDSDFFAHLKRNWLWTNPLLSDKKERSSDEMSNSKVRLRGLLSKSSLMMALKAGGSASPRCVTTKRPLISVEDVEVAIEPASRNQQVVGGKKQKRKRSKKEVVKIPRKKKKDEVKKRTPAHDEADHKALKRMTRHRVYWSVQEDSLMMLCSVASQLLNSQMKRPFVPFCVVRDMLHAEFEKSLDKTSLAVGRRTRYILKNPQTLLNYRICLAEVYQDKPLMELLEKKKPGNPDEPEECAAAFTEYTRLLRQKFSSAMTSCDIFLPDTKKELFSRFKVYTIDDGKQMALNDTLNSKEDIHAIVLNNLIQSTLAMSNSQMKSCRSFQTFHTYSTFNQEVLCQVFLQCRRRGLVNRRRVSQLDGRKKNRALPILPMSYQLSQTYYRCFSWRFPHAVCTDVFQFVRALTANGTGEDRPLTDFYQEPEERTEEKEEPKETGAEAGGEGKKEEEEEEVKEGGGETQRKNKEGDGREDDRRMDELEGRTEKGNNEVTKENIHSKDDEEKMEVEEKNEEEEGNSKTNELSRQENPEQSFTVNSSNEPAAREQTQFSLPQEKQPGSGPTASREPQPLDDTREQTQFSLPQEKQPGSGPTASCEPQPLDDTREQTQFSLPQEKQPGSGPTASREPQPLDDTREQTQFSLPQEKQPESGPTASREPQPLDDTREQTQFSLPQEKQPGSGPTASREPQPLDDTREQTQFSLPQEKQPGSGPTASREPQPLDDTREQTQFSLPQEKQPGSGPTASREPQPLDDTREQTQFSLPQEKQPGSGPTASREPQPLDDTREQTQFSLPQEKQPESGPTASREPQPLDDTREQTQFSLPQEKQPGSGPTASREPQPLDDTREQTQFSLPQEKQPGSGPTASREPQPLDDTREQTQFSLPQEKQPGSGPTASREPQPLDDLQELSDMMHFPLDSPGGAILACVSLMTLGLLSVHVSIPKQMVVVDSSLVDNEVVKSMAALVEDDDEDDDAEVCEGRKRMEVKARQASHTNYLMMRGYCCPGIVKIRNLNPNDNIVVESCIMRLKLRSTPAHHMFSEEVSPLLDYFKRGPSLLPSSLSYSICPPSSSSSQSSEEECDVRLIHQRGYSPQDVEACAKLRRSLAAAGQTGLGVHDLLREHTHLAKPQSGRTRGLQQYIQELQEEGQVLRVGGLGVRCVLMQHARPWLLTSTSRNRSRSPTRYRSRLQERQHSTPLVRKRGLEDHEVDVEPPRKRLAEDGEQVVVVEEEERGEADVPSRTIVDGERSEGEKEGEEREEGGKRSGDGMLNSEEERGKQTLPEEEGKRETEEEEGTRGEETEKTEERLEEGEEERERTECDDGASGFSPPASAADSDDGGDVGFISRPWRLVDGSLNRPVCKGMLEAVLYHIMSRPGLTSHTLVEHYRDVLQPMVVLDLTEALVEMGCVRKRTLIKSHKPSLFSRPGSQSGGRTGVRMEETETVFYEPTISCGLRLAHVLPNEPHWNPFLQFT